MYLYFRSLTNIKDFFYALVRYGLYLMMVEIVSMKLDPLYLFRFVVHIFFFFLWFFFFNYHVFFDCSYWQCLNSELLVVLK